METTKNWVEMTDEELLDELLSSDLHPQDKARVILSQRESRALKRHNLLILILTIVVAVAALLQGLSVIVPNLGTNRPAHQCRGLE